jgi:hypothetical protein
MSDVNLVLDSTFDCGADEILAKEVGDTLYRAYPKFMWMVEITDHNVIIRLGEAIQHGWCFFISRKDIPVGSPERLRKMARTAGGEMLERLNICRSAKEDGQEFGFFEGTEHKRMATIARPQ